LTANDQRTEIGMGLLTRWLDLVARVGKRVSGDQREREIPDDPLVA